MFGAGGTFTESDNTTYTVEGTPTGAATAEQTLTDGSIEVGGVTVTIDGFVERTYTVEVYP